MSEEAREGTIFKNSRNKISSIQITKEIVLLLLFGIFASVMKVYAKNPMSLPGHEWLIWVSLLVIGRAVSPFRWAGSVMGVGAASFSFLPFLGPQEPFMAFYFFIPALVFDLIYALFQNFSKNNLLLIPIAGIALLSKAILQYGIYAIVGLHWGAARNGLYYPLFTHLAFGLAGGLIGVIILRYIERGKHSLEA